MANRRYIDFPIASTVGDSDIILIWQSGANKQTTKATFLSGLPENLDELNDVAISGLTNGQILRYDSVTGKWENTDQGNLDLNDLNDVQIVSPSNGQVLVYNSSTSKWENSSGGYVPYTGAVTTVNLGAQTIQAGSFVKAGGTAAQFLKANGSVDSTVYGTGSVTSVALTMPTAFSVAGSPITTAGTLAVTGAGNVGQYIRGDGSLADFPESSGGGSSVSYYLNGSVAQGTIGGVAYKEINKVPIIGGGTDFSIGADGYIASFITDAGDPNLLEIPGGNWNFETYFSASSSGGTPTFYVELYKVNSGGTATLIASNSAFPEFIAFGTNIISYFSTLAVPTTALALTDRLAIRYYVTHSGRTITLHTEDNHLCQIITTFTTGITALNGLTAQVQNFAVGTSGTDFAISSATATHTFNLPTASATNRGALSSADWTTFNNKTSNLGTVTSVGLSSATSGVTIGSTPVTTSGTITLAIATASGSQNGLLSSTDWTTFNGKQNALTNPVTGTGTTNYLPKFTGASTIGNSQVFDNGTLVGIGTANPEGKLTIEGTSAQPPTSGTTANSLLQLKGSLGNELNLGSNTVAGNYGAYIQASDNNLAVPYQLNLQPTGGNVIIGSYTDNGAKLQVNGTLDARGDVTIGSRTADTDSTLTFANGSDAQVRIIAQDFTTDGRLGFWLNKSGVGFVERLIIERNSGNVGIGVTPSPWSVVVPAIQIGDRGGYIAAQNGTNVLRFGSNNYFNGSSFIYTTTDRASYFETGNGEFKWFQAPSGTAGNAITFTQAMTLDSSGRLGVGTGSSALNNHITFTQTIGGSPANLSELEPYSTVKIKGRPDRNNIVYIGALDALTGMLIQSGTTSTAAALSIQPFGGNVLIGTTTDSGYKLDVNGTGRFSGQITVSSNNGIVVGANGRAFIREKTGGDAEIGAPLNGALFLLANGSTVLSFSGGAATFSSLGTGSVTATAGLLSTVSDLSYKIEDGFIDSAIEKVLSLKPRYFYWNEKSGLPTDKRQLGFYAQEVNQALGEEAANTPKDKNTPWGISDRSMIAMLTKAIQELKQEIDTLKS